ncbi:hypothetical protein [Micromonospora sp. IBHARD004]|uniref:hypothetical protein n=1 Tax=Micromonospora sp. IBHARD004 TaxID=3457764 RepID=UPI0040586821
MSDEQLLPGEDLAAWGARTGRYPAARAAYWRQALAVERRQITASANPDTPSQVEATIRSLYPVLSVQQDPAPGQVWAKDDTGRTVLASTLRPSYAASATPLVDELDRALYGPSQAERYAQQDVTAEAELLRQEEEHQRRLAESQLTADEQRALFGN